jgi:hypothetical protein
MTDENPDDAATRRAVEQLLSRACLPASDEEIVEMCAAYRVIRGSVAMLYSGQVEDLLR